MPNYAIKSSGIRQVAANSLIGNSTGSTGSAEELSATDAKTLLGLSTTDSPTFDDITATGQVFIPSGTSVNPSLCFTGAVQKRIGFYEATADTVIGVATGGGFRHAFGSSYIATRSTSSFAWSSTTDPSSTRDLTLYRDGSGILAQRNGTSPNSLNIFNSWTDSSNSEGFKIDWQTLPNYCLLETFATGTGVAREMRLQAAAGRFYLKASGSTYAVVTDGNGNEKYDFIDGTFSSRSTANLGSTTSRWSSLYAASAFLGGDTVTASTPMIDLAQTWNDAAVTFDAITADITDTASASDSNLINLKVGGTSKIKVDRLGGLRNFNSNDGSGNYESGVFEFVSNVLEVGSHKAGTGSSRSVDIIYGGTRAVRFSTITKFYQTVKFNSSSYNIGESPNNSSPGDIWAQEGMFAGNSSTPGRILAYNLYSDASNYERGGFDWNTTANTLTIGTEAAGTGTERAVEFVGSAFDFDNKTITAGELQLGNTGQCKLDFAGTSLYATGPEGIIFRFESDTTNASVFRFYGNSGDQLTASSGVQSFFDVDADVNQGSTAGYTGIDLDVTESATGSGDKNLMDLKVGGTSKFKVDNAGNAVISGVVNQMTSSAALPSTTEFPNDQDWGIHHDTANDHIYLAFNQSGSIKKTLIN